MVHHVLKMALRRSSSQYKSTLFSAVWDVRELMAAGSGTSPGLLRAAAASLPAMGVGVYPR